MRRIFAIAGLNLLQVRRNRNEIISYVVLPLLLTGMFGLAFGGGASTKPIALPVADDDRTVYSAMVVKVIDQSKAYHAQLMNDASARAEVRSGDAPLAVVIPAGFGRDVERGLTGRITTVRDPSASTGQAAVEVVRGAASRIAADALAAHATFGAIQTASGGVYPAGGRDFRALYAEADKFWSPSPPVAVRVAEVRASATHKAELSAPATSQYSMGFTVFFVLMICIAGAGGIMEEREFGTLRRLLSTPTTRSGILGGKLVGVASIGALEAAILVGFGVVLFHVPWGSAPLGVVMVLGSLVLASTGLGVMLTATLRTRSQLSAISSVLSTALAMIGGCYWPVEITPPLMQTMALFTPTGWAMWGLKNVVARGMGPASAVVPSLVLLGMAALFFAIGISRLRLE